MCAARLSLIWTSWTCIARFERREDAKQKEFWSRLSRVLRRRGCASLVFGAVVRWSCWVVVAVMVMVLGLLALGEKVMIAGR